MKKADDGKGDETQAGEGRGGISRRSVARGFAALAAALTQAGTSWAANAEGIARQYRPVGLGVDYATRDSVYYDPQYPPIHFPHVFMSQGTPIQSFMWLASGAEPRGCVILSPQRYGGDSLDSLVPALLGAGIHVMRFNPRGMWDSEHQYSFISALEDLHAAVAYLREDGGRHTVPPGVAADERLFQIDPDHIAVLGKSGGGGMLGWIGAAENPGLNTAITVSPSELMKAPLPANVQKWFNDLKKSTAGRVDLVAELNRVTPAEFERLSMRKAAAKLVDKNMLLVGHSSREYMQSTHEPLVKAMLDAGAKHFSQAVFQANDYYLTARIALAQLVISWLKEECGF
ncbi:alpha/beta hydrolase family protein [Sphingobium tyrosinilyticum]|uniref:Alpha/beta hydrolase family protein n=1 Tax=Sphingobium tyrosinilyticum TaxID=2715436 RepID=A0ABV9F0P8_9SPHN